MAVSDVLGKLRQSGYSDKGAKPPEDKTSSEGVRVLKLTDEEKQALEQVPDGKEVKCDVTARKSGDSLTVMSVTYTGDDMDEMAKEVAGSPMGGAPLVNNQVQPSPS